MYYIQKEIIKICPSLIILFGKRLYYDYFLEFVKKVCEDKNSELSSNKDLNFVRIGFNCKLIQS